MKRTSTIALLLCLLALRPTWAQELHFHSAADGVSFDIPSGWVQVPKEQIDAIASTARARAPNARGSTPSYAFQKGNIGNWITPPYILVVARKSGPAPAGHLEKIASSSTAGVNERVNESLSEFVRNFNHGQPIFDSKTGYLWIHTRSNVVGRGDMSGVMVVIPTSYGEIQMQGYVEERKFETFLQEFNRLIGSMKLDTPARH